MPDLTPLTPYFARKSLASLKLSDALRQHADKLLDVFGEDSRVQVAHVFEALFPLNTPASANVALNRLIRGINDAASAQGMPLRACITTDKKGGASKRQVWFEGPLPAPAPAYMPELAAIPPGRLVTDQRGVPLVEAPVVVLITFNEHETAAVLRQFHPGGLPASETRNGMAYNLLGQHGGMSVVHRISKQGEGEAQNAAHDALRDWRPRALIAVGIAFGVNPAKQAIGDVLVSENVRGYELGRVNADGTVTLRSDKPPTSSVLFQRFNHLNQTLCANPGACTHWPTVRTGTLLSGNKLVDNLDYRNSLLKLESEAIGGEMEAVGIQLAADRHKVDWIIVKAICDWGDGHKNSKSKDADQKLAAANAALVVGRALELGPLYPGTPATPEPGRVLQGRPPGTRVMNLRDRENIICLIEDTLGQPASLDKEGIVAAPDPARGVGVIDTLLQWVEQADAPLFALLGEYGMGKTVTCQRLAQVLEQRHQSDPTAPLPLYFDLRHVTGLDRRVPTLKETVEECMARGWLEAGDAAGYTLESLYRWLEPGAVVIFDGLDEVLVKLKEGEGQVFTRELLKLKAEIDARRRAPGQAVPPLKLLISCRTQYFRTLREQQNHFTGQERGDRGADAYRALVLLPLGEEQVSRYLAAAVPGADPERLKEAIRAVHNLEELTQRPYTLKLVAEFIPEIESERLAGKTVHGVSLYRRMAQRWLERDAGKHHIRPEHKLRLAAHLAAHLWRKGTGLLPAGDIEAWFHEWLEGEPDLRRRYKDLHPDQLEEDLRTATFLAREDRENDSHFRFAHTSLLEFFLADYLFHAIQAGARDRWAMQTPSDETLDFLGQMLAEAGDPALPRTLESWRAPYQPQASELLLAYALRALGKGWPVPRLNGIDLAGADLSDQVFLSPPPPGEGPGERETRPRTSDGKQQPPLLDLSNANFRNTTLRRAVFDQVRLQGACFAGAQLAQSQFLDCDATGADWSQAECTAAVWRKCRLEGGRWQETRGYRPEFLFCSGQPGPGPLFTAPLSAPLDMPCASARLAPGLAGHQGWVSATAWSPDGARLASAGEDGSVRLWDAASGAEVLRLAGHQGWVSATAWSPDGARLASAGEDGSVRLWDAVSGGEVLRLDGHQGGVLATAWSPDGARLASAGDDGNVRLWDVASGAEVLRLVGHKGWVDPCVWSPDGTRLASAGKDGSVRLWDAASGTEVLRLAGHEGGGYACAWSPDGARLASAGSDGSVRLWDAASGTEILRLAGHQGRVWATAWSPDGTRLASAGSDGSVRLWDAASGAEVLRLAGHQGGVNACAWSPDGARLASAGKDGSVRLWDAASGAEVLRLAGHQGRVWATTWSPDGARLACAGLDDSLRLWDVTSGAEVLRLARHQSGVDAYSWSPDGARLASTGADGSVRLWDTVSGGEVLRLAGHQGGVRAMVWSPDGARLASAGKDGSVRLWNAASGAEVQRLAGHQGWVSAAAWSPDGARLASAGKDGSLRLWDAASGTEHLCLVGHQGWVSAAAWSPDGARLASAGKDGSLRLWDAASGAEHLRLAGHQGWILATAWSPDGTRLASAGKDGSVRLWDAASGAEVLRLTGHQGGVNTCAWSPDGARLASAGEDGTLRLWDAASGRCLRIHALSSPDHRGRVGHAVWAPETSHLIEAEGPIWRELAWLRPGPDGWPERLPLETFGPLPPPLLLRGE